MRWIGVLAALSLWSCQAAPKEPAQFTEAQALVEQIVAKHPNLVRLTIHAVPAGQTGSRIIACNAREKIGRTSDPEDIEAMKTGRPVALREGSSLDVTAPILDASGKAIAATGITVSFAAGAGEEQLAKEAEAIARELSEAVRVAGHPLW